MSQGASCFGLLVYSGSYYCNIGDDIQTLAARQFLPKIDYLIPIDRIREFAPKQAKPRETKVILNGWFTANPDSWPPSEYIYPLFVSFHIGETVWPGYPILGQNTNLPAVDVLLKDEFIPYYKEFGPIGCRDQNTRLRFFEKGVPAYFSACLTMTLKRWINRRTNQVCLVDVKCDKALLVEKMLFGFGGKVVEASHTFRSAGMDTDQRLKLARQFLELYQTSSLVITSRLHCALPCLAFGTPVIFVFPESNEFRLDSRFSGLADLMHVVFAEQLSLWNFRPSWAAYTRSPTAFRFYARKLRKRCADFILK